MHQNEILLGLQAAKRWDSALRRKNFRAPCSLGSEVRTFLWDEVTTGEVRRGERGGEDILPLTCYKYVRWQSVCFFEPFCSENG